MSLDKSDIDRLVRQMEELTSEAHVLWQAVDEAREQIVYELRRLVDAQNTPAMPQKSPQTSVEEPKAETPPKKSGKRPKPTELF